MAGYNGKQFIEEMFSRGGLLEKKIANYEIRPPQKKIALAIERAIREKRYLIVEAGTGIGKTYSYLVPALLFTKNTGQKIVISTYTKNLQLQLFSQDLPRIMEIMDLDCKVALLMGKNNYFCHSRLGRLNLNEVDMPRNLLAKIHLWAEETTTGAYEDWPFSNQPNLWQYFAADVDNCLHHFCPYQSKCFALKARKNCQDADIIIVNHHLFFSDLVLKKDGESSVLPSYSNIIFDEAHRLEEAGVNFLGIKFTLEIVESVLKDTEVIIADLAEKKENAKVLQNLVLNIKVIKEKSKLFFYYLQNYIGENENILLEKGWLTSFLNQPQEILLALDNFLTSLDALPEIPSDELKNALWDIKANTRKIYTNIQHFILGDLPDFVFWAAMDGKIPGLFGLPLGVNGYLEDAFFPELEFALFTSATLSVDNEMSYFISSLGIPPDRADYLSISSPFDYSYQARLMIPLGLPDPNAPEYTKESAVFLKHLLSILGPRSLFLFTSYKMLQEVKNALFDLTKEQAIKILVQGEKGHQNLINEFKSTDKAILLGTSGFWEGVDLPGDYLTSLVIFRLPFPVPSDPWIKGKSKQISDSGRNPFISLSLPQAVIKFKQGLGRLIRSFDDRGLFIVLDKRIYSKNYSRIFLNALPSGIPLIKGDKELILKAGQEFWGT